MRWIVLLVDSVYFAQVESFMGVIYDGTRKKGTFWPHPPCAVATGSQTKQAPGSRETEAGADWDKMCK